MENFIRFLLCSPFSIEKTSFSFLLFTQRLLLFLFAYQRAEVSSAIASRIFTSPSSCNSRLTSCLAAYAMIEFSLNFVALLFWFLEGFRFISSLPVSPGSVDGSELERFLFWCLHEPYLIATKPLRLSTLDWWRILAIFQAKSYFAARWNLSTSTRFLVIFRLLFKKSRFISHGLDF